MLFGILTLLTALAIAGVAAWFSIIGLMSIFSAAAMPIAVMAGVLEVGKLLTASWLYRYWDETGILLKTYLSVAVAVLMLITSMGIFGYLSKAHLDQAGESGDAFAIVERLEGKIAREENKIDILEDRIASLQTGGGLDVSSSIQQQETIRDGAWDRVQGDIDYAQGQIQSIRDQLVIDLKAQDGKLIPLDKIVDSYANQGTVTTETDSGGIFRSAETETVDNVALANEVRLGQKAERDAISDEKDNLRQIAQKDINSQQANIDKYRAQAQTVIDNANKEINSLRENSSQDQDGILLKIDDYNEQIDTIYDDLIIIKDEKFEAESTVRELEKEVGPIKYVAQLVYGDDSATVLDKAVRLFILLLVFVFDPLAVILIIAANQTLLRYGINLESKGPPVPPTPTEPPPENELEQNWDSKDLGNVADDLVDQYEHQVNHLKEQLVADRTAQMVAAEDAATAMAESAAKKKD
ncbi:hypothetical protein N9O93_01495 [bacterium]|nr:hypothetical protein [Hellea sp.]MDA9047798.1 hypothetical protein [Hellea sp.]MDA9225347.1 hypothetical protein [bacterium]